MYLVCWNHDCRQTYSAKEFKPEDRNVDCKKCGGTLISNSGKVEISRIADVIKTVDPDKYEESKNRFDIDDDI